MASLRQTGVKRRPAAARWTAGWRTLSLVMATSVGVMASAGAEELRRYDVDVYGAMSKIDIAYGRVPTAGSTLLHRWVVAGRDADSNLRIKGFAFTSSTRQNIDNTWTTTAGGVSQVAVAWVGANDYDGQDDRFVTAVRDTDGKLRLMSWRYGEAARLDTATFLPAIKNSQISIASLFNGYVATAAREPDDDIRLDLWRVTSAGFIHHRASAVAGRGSFANVVYGFNGQIVAVFRDTDGRLSTQEFSISTQYDRLVWASGWVSSLAGKVKARSYNDRYILAAFETSAGTLGVYFFDTQGDIHWHAGNIQSGHGTGAIEDLAVNGTGKVTTAVRMPSGNMKVVRWEFSGAAVTRETDNEVSGYPEGAASALAVEGGSGAGEDISTHDQLLTAVADEHGDLRVTVWHSR